MSKSPYKSKATPKPQKPKAPPRPSIFEFTPYIELMRERVERDQIWLKAIYDKEFLPDPAIFGLSTVEQVYDQIVEGRNHCAKILRNWELWLEKTAPVSEVYEVGRFVVDLNDPECYWHEADLDSLRFDEYYKRITSNTGKWRKIHELRGVLLLGDKEQARILINVYRTVMREYVYHHGFQGYDEIGILFHDNCYEKFGSWFESNKPTMIK